MTDTTTRDTSSMPENAVKRIEAGLVRWALDVIENGQTVCDKSGNPLLDANGEPVRVTATPAVAEVCRKLLAQLRPVQKERNPVTEFLQKQKEATAAGGSIPPVDMDGEDRAVS